MSFYHPVAQHEPGCKRIHKLDVDLQSLTNACSAHAKQDSERALVAMEDSFNLLHICSEGESTCTSRIAITIYRLILGNIFAIDRNSIFKNMDELGEAAYRFEKNLHHATSLLFHT